LFIIDYKLQKRPGFPIIPALSHNYINITEIITALLPCFRKGQQLAIGGSYYGRYPKALIGIIAIFENKFYRQLCDAMMIILTKYDDRQQEIKLTHIHLRFFELMP
jgi:hypothetical protein